jgi:hypothetical protein
VELDKERESGKKTGKVVDKPELGRESCYLYQNPAFLTYGSTWSEQTVYSQTSVVSIHTTQHQSSQHKHSYL